MASTARYYAGPTATSKFAAELLVKAGLSEEDGKTMADCLVLADVRGVDTHGLACLPQCSGIAILMDVMSGVLTGAAFGGEVGDQHKDPRPQNVGHCFIAIKLDIFLTTNEFRARMDVLAQRVHGVTPAPGFNEVLFPGEPEHRLGVQRHREWIPYADAERQMFLHAAKQYGVASRYTE